MKNRKTFASRLTKEMLVANGYELITEDGKVFKNGKQIWEMKDNKMVKTFCIETELDNIKQTEEFQELLIFYNYVIKSEYKDKKMKLEDKFL